MKNKLKNLVTKGVVDVSPLMIPVVPFGIIYGVIGMEIGSKCLYDICECQ